MSICGTDDGVNGLGGGGLKVRRNTEMIPLNVVGQPPSKRQVYTETCHMHMHARTDTHIVS